MSKSSKPYVSSIVNKYGDTDRVRADTKVLFDILDRQGSALLIDALAEYAAVSMAKFNLGNSDKAMTKIALVDSLEEAINERI